MYTVVHLVTSTAYGGVTPHVLSLIRYLDTHEYKNVLCTGVTKNEDDYTKDVRKILVPGLSNKIGPNQIIAYRNLCKILKSVKPDILHTNSSAAGIVGRVAGRKCKVPIMIHTVHGWGIEALKNPVTRKMYIRSERVCAKSTDTLIVVSEADNKTGLMYGIGKPSQYCLIRSGIDTKKFLSASNSQNSVRTIKGCKIKRGSVVIGMVGRLAPQKNPLMLLEVAKVLDNKFPNLIWVFVGDGPLRKDMESVVSAHGLEGKVIITGFQKDITPYVYAFDIFVLSSEYEGLPRTLPEAMCAKKPVVTTDFPSAKEIVQDGVTGFIVRRGDTRMFAMRLTTLIQDKRLREKMGTKAKERVSDFDERVMCEKTLFLYEQLLERKGLMKKRMRTE